MLLIGFVATRDSSDNSSHQSRGSSIDSPCPPCVQRDCPSPPVVQCPGNIASVEGTVAPAQLYEAASRSVENEERLSAVFEKAWGLKAKSFFKTECHGDVCQITPLERAGWVERLHEEEVSLSFRGVQYGPGIQAYVVLEDQALDQQRRYLLEVVTRLRSLPQLADCVRSRKITGVITIAVRIEGGRMIADVNGDAADGVAVACARMNVEAALRLETVPQKVTMVPDAVMWLVRPPTP